ncbi:MAG TPA: PQQ-binding-like beta-propeller repeat protein, partial [Armatimonadota bacterium]|nr:PQQ-binding-like beta-propeller repeat protein [Armatimonadota bacterium]
MVTIMRLTRTSCVFALAALAVCATCLQAADWPMWRCDAMRSAATDEQLPAPLHLQWVRQYAALQPAWPDEPRMRFDVAYEPIVAGGKAFIASPAADSLTALDLATGEELWRSYLGGPVRFAPAFWQGRLYAACDDGCLYCLSAADGTVAWKFLAGPSERRVLGNGRLISSWPMRGAPVVADGKVYCAAGIWPFMGIFIYALDARTGEVVWVNDGQGAEYTDQPHGGALAFGSVAPQGYMAVSGERLIVPSGRSVPAVFDRNTGAMLYYHLAENKSSGNFAACATSGLFFNSGRVYQLETGTPPGNVGADPVVTDQVVYTAEGGEIVAYDPTSAQVVEREDSRQKKYKVLELTKLWEGPKATRVCAKAGDMLYCIGDHGISAVSVPAGGTPEEVWSEALDDEPASLVVASGRLLVSTLAGRVLCYGPDEVQVREHQAQAPPLPPDDPWAQRARDILDRTGVTEGYCLCLGVGSGRLIQELVRQSELQVIGVDGDATRVDALRRRLDELGIYGARAALIADEPATTPLPPYMASLIVSEDLNAAGFAAGDAFIKHLFEPLRPYGGVACLPVAAGEQARFAGLVQSAGLANATVERSGDWALLRRPGPLPGAADWTHQYADAANTVVSRDSLVRVPLGLLWFGGSSNASILPRHGHGPPEQVVGGRLFIEGPDSIRAQDVYTGRVLWERELPGFGKPYDNTSHQPGANALGSNYSSATDGIYAAWGDRCLRLDPATGETMAEFILPPTEGSDQPQGWGFISVCGDLLAAGASPIIFDGEKPIGVLDNWDATSSRQIVVMDRNSGEVLWKHDCRLAFRHNAICIGGGKLFCIDRLPDAIVAKLDRRGEEATEPASLEALDLRTGRLLWRTTENVFGTWLSYSEEHGLLLQAGRPSRDMLSGEPGDRMIAYRGDDGTVAWDQAVEYQGPPLLHGDTIITQGAALSLLTGRTITSANPITGVESPWGFKRMYGCNTVVASEYLLTFRSGAAGFYDLAGDGGTGNLGGFKSGCTSNLIVADGVLNAPDYTRTCTCRYQNQASQAYVHVPGNEMWTFQSYGVGATDRIRRVGVNFAAPGDRKADNGTLWL